jgi:hypothetical protein
LRVLTILVRFGTERYPRAEQEIDDIFSRQMPEIERTVVVVDNALPTGFQEGHGRRVVIGGDNRAREFSGLDQAVRHIGNDIWQYDLVHFATEAFNTLYVDYLVRFDTALLKAMAGRPVCVGHIDCYNTPVEILGFRTQHWIRTCFFFMSPIEARALGSLVTLRDRHRFFSGDPAAPFRSDAPISESYRKYLIDWITGRDIGQGTKWHSAFTLTPETLASFEIKAMCSIMNEHLLGVRLRAMGCNLVDVTWLATTLPRGGASSVTWKTHWREQLANRDQVALVLVPS